MFIYYLIKYAYIYIYIYIYICVCVCVCVYVCVCVCSRTSVLYITGKKNKMRLIGNFEELQV